MTSQQDDKEQKKRLKEFRLEFAQYALPSLSPQNFQVPSELVTQTPSTIILLIIISILLPLSIFGYVISCHYPKFISHFFHLATRCLLAVISFNRDSIKSSDLFVSRVRHDSSRTSVQPEHIVRRDGYSQGNTFETVPIHHPALCYASSYLANQDTISRKWAITPNLTRGDPSLYAGSPATRLCSVLHDQQPTSAREPWQQIIAFFEGKSPCLGKEVFIGGTGKRSPQLAALPPCSLFRPVDPSNGPTSSWRCQNEPECAQVSGIIDDHV